MSRGFTIRVGDNKIITNEDRVHIQVIQWLQYAYPRAIFHSDAAGELMTASMRIRQSKVNMKEMSWPDLEIPEAHRGFFGMYVEIKREGEQLYKANGTLKNDHLERQAHILGKLTARNYYAIFAKGFEEITQQITWYLSGPKTKVPKHKII
jgi:hypothetical protein